MARRRGFFAELQHQAAVAERNRQRQYAAAVRDAERHSREAQRARAAAERARAAAARADARARAEAEREAKRLHIEAQIAEAEARTAELQSRLEEIDEILAATLRVDDYVDLEQLREVPVHPPFASAHQTPLTQPTPPPAPPEPIFVPPSAPGGLGGVFGKKKHAAAVDAARAAFDPRWRAWKRRVDAIPAEHQVALERHRRAETERLVKLATDRAEYELDCRDREIKAENQNAALDDLIRRFAAGERAAVEEYFAIVFDNSVYPDGIDVVVEHTYEAAEKELTVELRLPAPGDIPTDRAYRYIRANDEITTAQQTLKEQRDRYSNLVCAIVLRTLHEVWESDRGGYVDTISLTAGVDHLDPATGQSTTTLLIASAVPRSEFETLDLAHVTPIETLRHLRAVVSKNPHGLVAIDLPHGIRR